MTWISELETIAPSSRSEVAAYAVDGRIPRLVCFPADIDELSRCLAAADRQGLAVIPAGCGSHLGVGRPPARYDLAISTRRMNRVLAHEAADLTVTVEAGITIAELEDRLAIAGQSLPLDPPRAEAATVGAVIATDAWGPLRHSQGRVRDLVIGLRAVLADGTIVRSGGQVVKNVAGYDLMKAFCGSHGALGIIAEASFKLRPLAEQSAMIRVAASNLSAAIEIALAVRELPVEPAALAALDPAAAALLSENGAVVLLALAGTATEIAAQVDELRRVHPSLRLTDAEPCRALLGQLAGFPCAGEGDWMLRLSALPSTLAALLEIVQDEARRIDVPSSIVCYPGSGVGWIRLAGGLRVQAAAGFVDRARASVCARGGHLVVTTLSPEAKEHIDPWGRLPAPGLQQRLRAAFDPAARLSRGRFG